jgi:hypothetical protein
VVIRVEAARTAQGTWDIRYPGLLPGAPAVSVDLVLAGTITLPRTPSFDPAVPANRDLALAVTTLKTPKEGEVDKFGKYLFEVLLGAVKDEAERLAKSNELSAIELSSADPEFHRLPWEMARSADGFLAGDGIGFVRLVPSPMGSRTVTVAPRVLFVVGSDLTDKRVKAGAEYFGLMRRLEATGLNLETRILVRATRKGIEEAVKRQRPSIVVFIGHGSIGAQGAGQLELAPEDRSQKTDYVTGAQLRALLHGIPQVIVMNACETGASSRSSVPLAWEMVDDSLPLAIGMTGRVADRACRLFTRRFFEALLLGEEVHVATALARREGMLHGSDPERSVDWAMPALFMLEGITVKVDTDAVKLMSERSQRAKSFRRIMNPLVVCGRTDCVTGFNTIVGSPSGRPVPRTLALRVSEKYEGDYPAKYGKTRVLEELAAIAALWGHVPCFVRRPPATLAGLGREILTRAYETRSAFGLGEPPEYEWFKLENHLSAGAGPLSNAVLTQLQLRGQKPPLTMEEVHPKVLLAALQLDLAALARDAAAQIGSIEDLRVVVFIDDFHFSPAAEQLMNEWISGYGLGSPGIPEPQIVPLVFTYSSVDKEVYRQTASTVRNLAEAQTMLIANVDLLSLPSPGDDELPYRQFLLSQKEMFMLPNEDGEKAVKFLEGLHKRVKGVPSRLESSRENDDISSFVEAAFVTAFLLEANDETILAQLAEKSKNGSR